MKIVALLAVVGSLLVAGQVLGQAPTVGEDGPPTLTELQRLQVQVLVKDLEIAQLKAQAAQQDFNAAREKLSTLAAKLQVAGYSLDLQQLTYTKVGP